MARYSTNVSAFKKRKGIAQSLIGPKRGFGSQSVQVLNTMNGKLNQITGGRMIDRGPLPLPVKPKYTAPIDYTLPENRGLVKANTPERKAAVLSEIKKIDTRTARKAKLGQRANLVREAKRYGWM